MINIGNLDILIAEINEYINQNNSQEITGLILNSVLKDIVEVLAKYADYKSLGIEITQEDGLYFTDTVGNIIMSITQDGLNVAYCDDNFIDYIKTHLNIPAPVSSDFITVTNDGLYIIDANKNILSSFTNDGFDCALISQHMISYLNSVLSITTNEIYTKESNTSYLITII